MIEFNKESSKFLKGIKENIIDIEKFLGYETSFTEVFWQKKIREIEIMENRIYDLYEEKKDREADKQYRMMLIAFQYTLEEMISNQRELEEELHKISKGDDN